MVLNHGVYMCLCDKLCHLLCIPWLGLAQHSAVTWTDILPVHKAVRHSMPHMTGYMLEVRHVHWHLKGDNDVPIGCLSLQSILTVCCLFSPAMTFRCWAHAPLNLPAVSFATAALARTWPSSSFRLCWQPCCPGLHSAQGQTLQGSWRLQQQQGSHLSQLCTPWQVPSSHCSP